MSKAKPPFKLAIAYVFVDGAQHAAPFVYEALQADYGTEKIFQLKTIESSLQALKSVGILAAVEGTTDEPEYKITPSGKEKVLANMR